MIKLFCDCCEKELGPHENKVNDQVCKTLKFGETVVAVRVMVSVDGVWNGGQVCEECLQKVLDS